MGVLSFVKNETKQTCSRPVYRTSVMNDTDNDWRIDAMYAANLKN